MAHTAIGIFRERSQAEAAVHQLMDNGFSREKMDIAFPDPKESRGDATDENGTLDSKVGRFFLNAFDGDADQALKYAAVGQRGVIIAVQSELYSGAQRAATIMDACGAINVEEEARIVEDGMTRSDRTMQDPNRTEAEKKTLEKNADAAAISGVNRPPSINYEERLNTGEYTIHSRIVERPIGGDQRIREEQTWVERNDESSDVAGDPTDDSARA